MNKTTNSNKLRKVPAKAGNDDPQQLTLRPQVQDVSPELLELGLRAVGNVLQREGSGDRWVGEADIVAMCNRQEAQHQDSQLQKVAARCVFKALRRFSSVDCGRRKPTLELEVDRVKIRLRFQQAMQQGQENTPESTSR